MANMTLRSLRHAASRLLEQFIVMCNLLQLAVGGLGLCFLEGMLETFALFFTLSDALWHTWREDRISEEGVDQK